VSLLRHVAGAIGLVLAIWTFASVCYVVLVLNDRGPAAITGSLDLVRSERPGERVLFVGNSLTAAHGMPEMVEKLAAGSPRANAILTVTYWRGGGTLAEAADDDRLKELLRSEPWDHVVLQEQSQIPARPELRQELMLPAAATLAGMAQDAGARTMLFMTWGREHGDPDAVPGDTYAAMQARVDEGYGAAASLIDAEVAPVGHAWATVIRNWPELRLWAPDGYHPSQAGTYLTACVFYALLAGADARESSYTGGLDPEIARGLQRIARDSVRR
jgi:hypothetical protein